VNWFPLNRGREVPGRVLQLARGHRGSLHDKPLEIEMARVDETIERSTPQRGRARSRRPPASEVVSLVEPLLDCDAAAALLNVRVSWVRDAVRLGQLPCLRVGRHLRFTRAMLEGWLVEQFVHSGRVGRPLGEPPGMGGDQVRVAYRPRTQAALLAALAESPKGRKGST
jgi:excisionase family DNA binding protein